MNDPTINEKNYILLKPGHHYKIYDLNTNSAVSVQCLSVEQRNWSRVGIGLIEIDAKKTQQVFLKQNVSKNGELLSDQWEYEKLGAIVADNLFQNTATIPQIKYHNPALALCVFEFFDIIPFDTLLRRNNRLFMKSFIDFLEHSTQILKTMQNPQGVSITDTLTVKQRPYGNPSTSINFKGFDVRNIGINNNTKNNPGSSEFIMFDFGRPYKAPIEEATAKLFISIGLLNWGRPIPRFARGPDTDLLAISFNYMKPFLCYESIAAELELQSKFRFSEVHGSGLVEKSLKKLGIDVLGNRYINKLGDWCTDNIDQVG